MSPHHPNHRLVKIHRSYTVEEIAHLLGKHKNTVRNWLHDGLAVIDDQRPALILGSVLVAFLKERRGRNRRRLRPGEIYCVRCRDAVRPAERMADCVEITDQIGDLRGICPRCESLIHRRVSLPNLDQAIGDLEITRPEAEPDIRGGHDGIENCDSTQGAEPHAKT